MSRAGQAVLAHSHSYEYPLRTGRGGGGGAARARLTLHPAPLSPAQLGDGSAALALEQKLGLL